MSKIMTTEVCEYIFSYNFFLNFFDTDSYKGVVGGGLLFLRSNLRTRRLNLEIFPATLLSP